MSKKLFIKTYGCQMNAYDSDRMAEIMRPHGYDMALEPEEADLIVLNTCHIREKAAEKVYSELGRLRSVKTAREEKGHDTLIAVAGCVAQAEGEEIRRRQPVVDMIFGPQTYHRLPDLVKQAQLGQGETLLTDFPVDEKFEALKKTKSRAAPAAFLTIQEGCDKFCAFCVVPYTRGAEYSRPAEQIIEDAKQLAAQGAREVTLLGQNVNAYAGEGPNNPSRRWSLARLVYALAEIDGLDRIRYTTSHPRDMGDDLIAAHRDIPKLMPYLHLPVQSGSDRILKAMNRGHTADTYRGIIDRLRTARPDIALSSDFIVGFPGETDEDFAQTMRLIEEVSFAQAYSFKYSRRPGTPAADLEDQVPEELKSERLNRLQALLKAQQTAFNRQFVDKEIDVLLEKTGRHPGQLAGRTPYLQAVQVAAETKFLGCIVTVKIDELLSHSLSGKLLDRVPLQVSGERSAPRPAAAQWQSSG